MTTHYRRQARRILRDYPELSKKIESAHELIAPDVPGIWYQGGFEVLNNIVFAASYAFNNYTPYIFEGDTERYSASTFAHRAHCVFVPLEQLADYLIAQMGLDETEGKWYDSITLREGDSRYYGLTATSLGFLFDDAEQLLLWLEKGGSGQKGREAGGFPYIQVCYLQEIN